jgi:hypothetical protein
MSENLQVEATNPEVQPDVYLEFSGWFKVDPDTKLQYTGVEQGVKEIITVAEWLKIPTKELRGEYILENFVDAVKDSEDLDFESLELEIETI